MKRCPTCNRSYTDDSQKFCLEDGATLIEETTASFDPQATIAMPAGQTTNPPSNPYGSGAGQGSYGAGAGQSPYGSGAGQSQYGSSAGQSSYGSGAGQSQQQTPSWSPTPPQFNPAAPAKKRSMLPWILGGVAVLLLGGIGLIVAIVLLASSSSSNTNNSSNSNLSSRSNSNNSNSNNSNKSNTNTRVSTGVPIVSPDGKIQITAPTTWKATTELNDKAELQASDTSNQMYLIVLTDDKSNYSSSMTLEKHSAETLGTLTKAMTSSTKIGPTRLTVNGNPALQYEVRGEIKGLNVVYLHTTVETSQNFHQIVSWTLQTTYDAKKDTLQEIIQSLKEN